ncbi:MAG: response regulator, partial [Flavobacteriales bacterium]|nr:response regulator [Flavobacteriales bacterium]
MHDIALQAATLKLAIMFVWGGDLQAINSEIVVIQDDLENFMSRTFSSLIALISNTTGYLNGHHNDRSHTIFDSTSEHLSSLTEAMNDPTLIYLSNAFVCNMAPLPIFGCQVPQVQRFDNVIIKDLAAFSRDTNAVIQTLCLCWNQSESVENTEERVEKAILANLASLKSRKENGSTLNVIYYQLLQVELEIIHDKINASESYHLSDLHLAALYTLEVNATQHDLFLIAALIQYRVGTLQLNSSNQTHQDPGYKDIVKCAESFERIGYSRVSENLRETYNWPSQTNRDANLPQEGLLDTRIVKHCQSISKCIDTRNLIDTTLSIILSYESISKAAFITSSGLKHIVHAYRRKDKDIIVIDRNLTSCTDDLSTTIVFDSLNTNQPSSASITRDDLLPDTYRYLRDNDVLFCGSIPLIVDELCLGALYLESKDLDSIDNAMRSNLGSIANQAAIALKNAKLYEDNVSDSADNMVKSRFKDVISHELKTPLNNLFGQLSLLISELDEKPAANSLYLTRAQKASDSTEELKLMLEDVLDNITHTPDTVAVASVSFNLRDAINSIYSRFRALAEAKGLEFKLFYETEIPSTVVGDKLIICKIIRYILDNSVKFTHRGHITVNVSCNMTSDTAFELKVRISDTGIGISPSILEEFSEKQLNIVDASRSRKYRGIGIGLANSLMFSKAINGKLEILSQNAGINRTIVTMTIPLGVGTDKQQQVAPATKSLSISEYAGRYEGNNILLVEDDPGTMEFMNDFLKSFGFIIHNAKTGQEAINIVKYSSFDICLMDIGLPDIDGFQVSLEITAKVKDHFPIIALSSFSKDTYEEKAIASGMDDYIEKPINSNIKEFISCLDLHLLGIEDDKPNVETKPWHETIDLNGRQWSSTYATELSGLNTINLAALLLTTYKSYEPRFLEPTFDNLVAGNNHKRITGIAHTLKYPAALLGAKNVFLAARTLEEIPESELDRVGEPVKEL